MRKIKLEKQLYIRVNIENAIILFYFIFYYFKASGQGHLEVVHLLINNERCNINEKDKVGKTALHSGEF